MLSHRRAMIGVGFAIPQPSPGAGRRADGRPQRIAMSLPPPACEGDLAVLGLLAERFAADQRQLAAPPLAIGVVGDDEGVELHVRALAATDPVREVLGFRAPDDWTAFGLVSRATSWPIDPSEPPGRPRPDEQDPRGERNLDHQPGPDDARTMGGHGEGFAYFGTRWGGATFALARAEGDVHVGTGTTGGEGRVADACRRVLGLPTPPPGHDSRQLLAVQWLDALAAAAMAGVPGSLTWAQAVMTNPHARRIAAVDAGLAAELADNLPAFGNAFRRAFPWAELRARHQAGVDVGLDLEPEHAAWMDDGMFARWVLGGHPPIDELLDIVDQRSSSEISRRVRSTLRAWGLTPPDRLRPLAPG
jgi:hypothetical protein